MYVLWANTGIHAYGLCKNLLVDFIESTQVEIGRLNNLYFYILLLAGKLKWILNLHKNNYRK